jgi:hypothetical protein
MHSFGDRYPQGAQLTHPVLNEYGQTDLLNRKLKRVTLLLSVMLIGVLTMLVLELIGVVPISPFQPDIKMKDTPAIPSHR